MTDDRPDRPWKLALIVLAVLGILFLLIDRRGSPRAGYEVVATLVRGQDFREPLGSGARVSVGDALSLELAASKPVFLYVLNEDEIGNWALLFPLPGLEPQNPLSARRLYRLPGSRDGKTFFWQVDSAGGKERIILVASSDRLPAFETAIGEGLYPRLESASLTRESGFRLRQEVNTLARRGGVPERYFTPIERLEAGPHRAEGLWVREITLENPESQVP